MSPGLLDKMDFNAFVPNSTVIMVLLGIVWGKMSVMTVGAFHVFIKIVTLIGVLQVNVHVFPKTSASMFSV